MTPLEKLTAVTKAVQKVLPKMAPFLLFPMEHLFIRRRFSAVIKLARQQPNAANGSWAFPSPPSRNPLSVFFMRFYVKMYE